MDKNNICTEFDQDNKYQKLIDAELSDKKSILYKFLQLDLQKEIKDPPAIGSEFNLREIKKAIYLQNTVIDAVKQFSVDMHDIKETYKLWAAERLTPHLTRADYNFYANIAQQTEGVIHYFKGMYNRPRPYQVCEHLGVDLAKLTKKPCSSASYPSGHACQSFLFAYIVGDLNYRHAKKALQLAHKISLSRVVAGVHFPSDVAAGKKLAQLIFANNLCEY